MTTILIVFIIVFSLWLINTLRKNGRNSETIIYNSKPITESPIREKISKPSVDFQKISEPSIDFRWLPFGEVIDIQGYTISAGMFYFGYGLKDKYGYQPEASLINPKLKANASANSVDTTIEEMGYWPNYSTISPACRGGYLNWLSQGRSQPNAYIGYVFLFFYGLERRLIVDDKSINENERNEIIEEILRLLELYGSNSSFYSYAQALLSLHWVLYGNRNEIPKYLTLENRRVSFPVQAQIGALINQGKPITSDWAVKWLRVHPTTYLGTPSRRCYLEFNELFSKKYEQKFGNGLQIKPNKTKLVFSYHPASPTIQSVSIPCEIPDIFALTKPITQLQEIAKECEEELSSYSRVLGKSETDKSQLPILATLPKPLFDTHPKARSIKNIIEQKQQSDFSIITTLELLAELDHSSISSISKREAEHIALLSAKLGYLIAPDIRFHNAKPDLNGNIVLIKSDDAVNFSASENYHSIALHTRLSALVSQIDGEVSISEEKIILKNIQFQNHLTEAEKKSLSSFAVWCLKNPQSNVGIKQRLASASFEEKAQIAKLVVSIAQADGNIAIQEIKQIEKLYSMIGLEKQQLLSDLHQQSPADDPIIVSDGTEETIYSLPKKPKQETTGFSIDHQKIQRLEEETRKVQSVLQTVFMDDELEQLEVTPIITPNNPVDNLTPVYKQLLESLIEHQTWTIQDYEQLCSDLKLMPNGAIEVLNDWSYNFANAPILEDGDPIFVDIDLYKEITND